MKQEQELLREVVDASSFVMFKFELERALST